MATAAMSSRVHSAATEYGVFWQLWPEFDVRSSERRLVGLEVELIGSHTSDLNHVDPACPRCQHVRSILLGIADLMMREGIPRRNFLMYDIDSHSNSIMCLPALGNRSAVSVSINFSWSHADGQACEELLGEMKTFLAQCGIHQR